MFIKIKKGLPAFKLKLEAQMTIDYAIMFSENTGSETKTQTSVQCSSVTAVNHTCSKNDIKHQLELAAENMVIQFGINCIDNIFIYYCFSAKNEDSSFKYT